MSSFLFEKLLESLRHLELEGEGNLLVRHVQLKENSWSQIRSHITFMNFRST
jgi:hypothetical protein